MILMKFKYHSFRCRQGPWAVGALLWKVKQATRSSAPYCHRKSDTDIPKSSILGPSRWVSVDVCVFECSIQWREQFSDFLSKTKFQGLIFVWICYLDNLELASDRQDKVGKCSLCHLIWSFAFVIFLQPLAVMFSNCTISTVIKLQIYKSSTKPRC